MQIKDRIKEFKRVKASELAPNPKNPRNHPEAQRESFRAMLKQIGFAGAELCYVSERNGGKLTLIDGHMRHHRYMFADWRFAVRVKDTWKATGGLAAQRSAETERKDFLLLKRMFGDAIIPKKDRPNIDKRDGKAQNKRKPNRWERELRLPF